MKNAKMALCLLLLILSANKLIAEDGYNLWLRYSKVNDAKLLADYRLQFENVSIVDNSAMRVTIEQELGCGLSGLLGKDVPSSENVENGTLIVGCIDSLDSSLIAGVDILGELTSEEGYCIYTKRVEVGVVTVITAKASTGLLYGAFELLRLIQTHKDITNLKIVEQPRIQYRVVNHWDNIDGSTERVYSENNRSIWWQYETDNPEKAKQRWCDYGRASASVGINMIILNNVNAHVETLSDKSLAHIKDIADTLRPYGVRVGITANVASCLKPSYNFRRGPGMGELDTLDPKDPAVIEWWRKKIAEIYGYVPDFAGFLIKAGSEGMPGPEAYGSTAAEAANMYGDLLKPYGGIVMWRTFTYEVDEPDQTKRQYIRFAPQDGGYNLGNVFLQNKYGSRDFMPREPFHPLFGGMNKTQMSIELQITQEYTGHDQYLMYWGPFWKEIFSSDTYAKGKGSTVGKVLDGTLFELPGSQIAGVGNVSRVKNWTGHDFAQANWYAFGRLAWDHELDASDIAEEWVRQTWGNDPEVVEKLTAMMMNSHEVVTSFVGPLGIAHTNTGDSNHYEPSPQAGNQWQAQFINADKDGIGTDRSATGTKATSQYCPEAARIFDNKETCPMGLQLWFHRYKWQDKLPDGKSVWQGMVDKYNYAIEQTSDNIVKWQSLQGKIDSERYERVLKRLRAQHDHALKFARIWLEKFHKLNGLPYLIKN